MNVLELIGREKPLFTADLEQNKEFLSSEISDSKFLIIGGAGTIGQSVAKEIFKRNPKVLHVIDINENNLVELVRDLRSSIGYIDGDFRTFAIDCGSSIFNECFKENGPYDYVLNLSALKHVRSEKDIFTLRRLIEVNILNTIKTIELSIESGVKKYFCVSTDKAANPVNMMGASKRIMEMFLMKYSNKINISSARFANVAFSDGSLLHGFDMRIKKKQPLAAPSDIKRYFVTIEESGQLCLLSCLLGQNMDIYFPKLSANLNLISFADIARLYLKDIGYHPFECQSEEEARTLIQKITAEKKWPCCFFRNDTTGEKSIEEFYAESDLIDLNKFTDIGIVKKSTQTDISKLDSFLQAFHSNREDKKHTKEDIVSLFKQLLPNFTHIEKNKYLDNKM